MALRDQPYLPLYVMDFMTDERLCECSAESVGVYIMVMCVMHKQSEYGTILLKQKDIQTAIQTDEQNADRSKIVALFARKLSRHIPFEKEVIERSLTELLDEGVLQLEGNNKLCQKRMMRDEALSCKRSKAVRKRWESSSEELVDTNANTKGDTKRHTNSENEIEIEYENETEDKREDDTKSSAASSAPKRNAQEERFDAFWRAYPRKSGKGSAKKAWMKIAPSQPMFAKIMAAVEEAKQCEQWRRDRGQYIPYPATWLNQERWDDDYGAPQLPEKEAKPPASFDPDNPYADWGDEDE